MSSGRGKGRRIRKKKKSYTADGKKRESEKINISRLLVQEDDKTKYRENVKEENKNEV